MLEANGFRFIEADSAQRGLLDARTHRPDLMLVDLGLPDRDGIEVIRRVREWSAVPIIVLSARSQEAVKIAALDAETSEHPERRAGQRALARAVVSLVHGEAEVTKCEEASAALFSEEIAALALSGGAASIDRGADRADVAAHQRGDVGAADLHLAGQRDVGGLGHRVGGGDGGDQALGLDQAEGFVVVAVA